MALLCLQQLFFYLLAQVQALLEEESQRHQLHNLLNMLQQLVLLIMSFQNR